jgi:Kef-type K+ transport system membrane component KefB
MKNLGFHLHLPIQEPILIFFVVLLIILVTPIVLKFFRIPSLTGLILAGVAIGPHGFHILNRDNSIVLFGTVGLLYIMFIAGLEIDLSDFKKNQNKSILFGILTFSFPICLGIPIVHYGLNFDWTSSILISSIFASHTLISYPIVSKMGISKIEAVNVSVGGTLITDTAALIVLAIVVGSFHGAVDIYFWIKLIISILLFGGIVLIGFPIIGRWFFRTVQDNISQYIFVLAMVFFGAIIAELAGLEPIIGAFFSGLALNRLIPNTSPLMNRTEFVGSAIFIPFFLISVGMLVNLKSLFSGKDAFTTASVMIIVGLIAKWLAAYSTQKILNYTKIERNLIFGLSSSRAAATLASALVGYKLGIFNESVLNGTILMIFVTCLVSSFIVEKSSKILATQKDDSSTLTTKIVERFLVPISNPKTIESLINLALLVKNPDSDQPIYALSVVKDNDEAKEKIFSSTKMLEKAIHHASSTDTLTQIITRVDLNISNGIIRASKDIFASDILIGWNPNLTAKDRIFGTLLTNLLENSDSMIWVSKWELPMNSVKKIIVIAPEFAQYELNFKLWIDKIHYLTKNLGSNLIIYSSKRTNQKIEFVLNDMKMTRNVVFKENKDLKEILSELKSPTKDDLWISIISRKGSISYHESMESIPQNISRNLKDTNFILLYP